MFHVVPETRLMTTLIESPGVTVQPESPLHLVSWASPFGNSSYHA